MTPFRMRAWHFVALVLFIGGLLVLVRYVTEHGEPYIEAQRFLYQDADIRSRIGNVRSVELSFWHGFSVASSGGNGTAELPFLVSADRGEYEVEVTLGGLNGVWKVRSVRIKDRAPANS